MTNLTERMLDNMVINILKEVIEDLERLTRSHNPAIKHPSTIVFLGDLLNDARAAYKKRTTVKAPPGLEPPVYGLGIANPEEKRTETEE